MQEDMTNDSKTNIISMSQDNLRFFHPILLCDFSEQVWRNFSFLTPSLNQVLVRGKHWEELDSSEEHAGIQI